MRQILLLSLILTGLNVFGQAPFERVYTVPNAVKMYGGTMDTQGRLFFATESADKNIQITCVGPDGTHAWTRTYPYFVAMGLYSQCIATNENGILVAGFALGGGTNSRDGIILHIAFDGTLINSTRVDVEGGSNAFHTLKATSDGFISGGRAGAFGNDYDMLLTKFSATGEVQWAKAFGTSGWDWAYDATELADGGFALIGYGDALGTGYSPSAYLVRTDALGNELWARSISSGNGVDEGYNVTEATDGSLYIGGRSLGYLPASINAWITKLTPGGDHVWTRVLEKGVETVTLIADHDDGVQWLIHPQWVTTLPGGYEMAWGKLDSDGNLVRSKVFGAPGNDYSVNMVAQDDGSLAILGSTSSYGASFQEWKALLIQTDTEGNAACDPLDSTLVWHDEFSAIVQPFTSLTNSAFTTYPWPLGTQPVAVDTYDPCCAVRPQFNPYPLGTGGFSWGFANTTTGASGYFWDFGDGTTSTETSPTHTYASSGTYIVCVTATGSCGEGTSCQAISITVGIDEARAAEHRPLLYPSPADGSFNISSPVPMELVRLVDSDGRIVKVVQAHGRMDLYVPTHELAPGVYAVEMWMRGGNQYHARIMVTH
ncbi:MAG: PKD domain-containing protein [Flavobacteriales bacterium]|nr:PKD domain-containing protein [Flavobacteriales bacterium]MEB2340685.1 PKD domain-containing protein [Flavobacteriia bacterium]